MLFRPQASSEQDYFTASQLQLIWSRFRHNRSAMVAAAFLCFFVGIGFFADFLSPYEPTVAGREDTYLNGAPQLPQFCDDNGCSLRPFIHGVERYRGADTNFRWVTKPTEERQYLTFLPHGWTYHVGAFHVIVPFTPIDLRWNGIPADLHLFGVDKGYIHLFGTDDAGKDLFSRTLHAIWVSLSIGTLSVILTAILALIIGGVSGYFGGPLDTLIQMFTDAIRTVPTIPLYMTLAAFVPSEWSAEMRYFFITLILALVGWPTLARRLRTHLLAERSADYVLAAELNGASSFHVLIKHLLPSFTSYIIVDVVISFPYMVLSETSLSFVGLGLKDPVNSLGVLLQKVTNVDVMLNYQWYFIPLPFFVGLVLAFVFVGDGLRDAADPYSDRK